MGERREILLHVLEVYREKPFLWNKLHKDYLNKALKNQAYAELLDIYKNYDSLATTKTLIKKIQNLRTNYKQEFKKVKRSLKNGSAHIYVPTLFYYDAFSFLEALDETSEGQDTLEDEDHWPSSSNEEESSSFQSAQHKLKRRKTSHEEIDGGNKDIMQVVRIKNEETRQSSSDEESRSNQSVPKAYKTTKKKRKASQENDANEAKTKYDKVNLKNEEWDILGKAIGLQMRDLDKKQLTIVQKLISDAIFYAKTGMLTESAFVSVSNSCVPYNFVVEQNSTKGSAI